MKCPNCGYCQHCGRSNAQPYRVVPITPYPWYQPEPYVQPYAPPFQPTWIGDTLPNPSTITIGIGNGGGTWS